MPKTTISAGVALVTLALVSYFGAGMASVTALIPSIFGLPLIGLGWLAMNEQRRKMMLQIAIGLGALGLLAPLSRILPALGSFELSIAMAANIGMALICGVYLAISIRALVEARHEQHVTA